MAMFFLFLGFIALWAITEIIETFLNEKGAVSKVRDSLHYFKDKQIHLC